MRARALLRKLAERQVRPTDADVRAEYELRYGQRVQIRHIQVPTLQETTEINRLLAAGQSFEQVARAHSRNLATAQDGGLLPAFAYVDPSVPATLREAAFELTPGQISKPIKVNEEYHILKLEQRLPGGQVSLEQVRAALEASVRDRLVAEKMRQLRDAMVARCRIRILDADLRRAYNENRKTLEGPLPPPARP
jgi:peptidyl-prolyl cis-trans isomerase D